MSTQFPDHIEIAGQTYPLSLTHSPHPLPKPHPRGLTIELYHSSPSFNRGYCADWRLHDGGLYLVALETEGAIVEPGMGTSDNPIRYRNLNLADIFGGKAPVPALWVSGEVHVAFDRESFKATPFGFLCGTWRVLTLREGVLVGDTLQPGRTRLWG